MITSNSRVKKLMLFRCISVCKRYMFRLIQAMALLKYFAFAFLRFEAEATNMSFFE